MHRQCKAPYLGYSTLERLSGLSLHLVYHWLIMMVAEKQLQFRYIYWEISYELSQIISCGQQPYLYGPIAAGAFAVCTIFRMMPAIFSSQKYQTRWAGQFNWWPPGNPISVRWPDHMITSTLKWLRPWGNVVGYVCSISFDINWYITFSHKLRRRDDVQVIVLERWIAGWRFGVVNTIDRYDSWAGSFASV